MMRDVHWWLPVIDMRSAPPAPKNTARACTGLKCRSQKLHLVHDADAPASVPVASDLRLVHDADAPASVPVAPDLRLVHDADAPASAP
eukprot:363486-Chlamydomonas_euryale.AAC.1